MADTLPAHVIHAGAPVDRAERVVVTVHGRDQDPAYMIQHVVDRLDLDRVAFVLPAAPHQRWYPAPLLAPFEVNAAELAASLNRLTEIENWLGHCGHPPDTVVWCGFSQGASLVATYVAGTAQLRGGLIAFTGGLIGPPGTKFHIGGSLDAMPVYLSASEADDWLPIDRARDTAAAFRHAGARVHLDVFTDRGHVISDPEIAAARALIQ
jgi:phospholipase/carboxylesterase